MKNRIRRLLASLLWVFVLPLLVVGFKYWQWERTLHVNETGIGFSVPLGSSTYARTLAVLYLPARTIVQSLVRPLRVGGVAVEFAIDIVSVLLQHAVLFLLWNAWQARRLRKLVNSTAGCSKT